MITIIPEYISKEEEEVILSHIRPSKVKVGFSRNTIIRYGSDLPYKAKIKGPIPPHFTSLCEKLDKDKIIVSDSVTINEYMSGQSIDWHVDSLSSGPVIVVLSLLSDAQMGLRNIKTNEIENYILPARSLLILDGEHRYEYQHCIFPVVSHRFSVVFRKGTDVNI